MSYLGRGFFFAALPQTSPVVDAAPAVLPVVLHFSISANAAPAVLPIVLHFSIAPATPSSAFLSL